MDIYGIIPITPYKVRYWINADLTTSLLTFPFTLAAIFMSQITPDICLHPLNGANHAENTGPVSETFHRLPSRSIFDLSHIKDGVNLCPKCSFLVYFQLNFIC